MTLLDDFKEKNLIDIYDETPTSWEEAIKVATSGMIREGYITSEYVDEIIKNVHDNGPYIVLVPGVAMPHASAKSKGVLGTAIGMAKFSDYVVFDENDEEKQAKLFFTLAAKDDAQHLNNITQLMELLMADEMIPTLESIENMDDFEKVIAKFSQELGN